ncbi:MAG: DUF4129 domain-containing protein [Anaeromyxobacter sp.]
MDPADPSAGAGALAGRAQAIVRRLEARGAGPAGALQEAARGAGAPGALVAFRAALERHCGLAAAPRLARATPEQRAALQALLAGPDYRAARADARALRRLLLDAWARLLELLGTSEAERYASFGRALALLAAAAAAALAVAVARRRRRLQPAARRQPPPAPAPLPPPDASLGEAEAALARGDGREAVRRAFLAALAALERSGAVPRGRARTNRELVAGEGPALAELAPLASLFDRVVYGQRPTAPAEAREAVVAARRIARGAR